ncbi:MAG: hypothetical protein SVR04_12385 [Spirochaetota bacterium]|nr:hypothetical protein [Spirochaetota bacterium]
MSLSVFTSLSTVSIFLTSVVAAMRGERDIAVGNVVGSNIYNILAVLGASALVSGDVGVAPGALHFDLPVMTAVVVACLPIFFTGGRISRWEGGLFAGYYIAYIAYLVFAASMHETAHTFSRAMLWFVIPATLLGIMVSLFYGLRALRRPS